MILNDLNFLHIFFTASFTFIHSFIYWFTWEHSIDDGLFLTNFWLIFILCLIYRVFVTYTYTFLSRKAFHRFLFSLSPSSSYTQCTWFEYKNNNQTLFEVSLDWVNIAFCIGKHMLVMYIFWFNWLRML